MAIFREVDAWIDEIARLTCPIDIQWCDGTDAEWETITEQMIRDRKLLRMNPNSHPNSFLYRSHPQDVSRTENVTFICSRNSTDSGPTNNWMDPVKAKADIGKLFAGSMRGRTMYVIPYLMGPAGSPHQKIGVELTDSPYVVLNMKIMTRMGRVAREQFSAATDFCAGLHSLGDLSPDRRYILHFPEERLIWSIGSGYGGNALLGKKCFALRIASTMARDEGWLAEHMLILGLEDPSGEVTYIAGAFPSSCGKTNLAMLTAPLEEKGYRVWTVGDDIAWMRPGPDGRLWAVNAEAGFFGVAPGTSRKTNLNAAATFQKNSIFTNVALTPDGGPWWEGMDEPLPPGTLDWQGRPFEPGGKNLAAHPNARYTTPASQCPSISPKWNDPQGVPISAILFGGRRARLMPLVVQSTSWRHGVYLGSVMASETTAAATGQVGVVRRDPMAMLPFCGYHMGDYFAHWLKMEKLLRRPPQIFHINWFRRGADGKFLWPGFGENVRVLRWIVDRVRNRPNTARESEIGWLPSPGAIDLSGLEISREIVEDLTHVDRDEWKKEAAEQQAFLQTFGDRLPAAIREEVTALTARIGA